MDDIERLLARAQRLMEDDDIRESDERLANTLTLIAIARILQLRDRSTIAWLTTDRVRHMRGVALFMYEHAPALGLDAEEAALCGWLHDFGYLTGDNRTHAMLAGRLLEREGYVHASEIRFHGTPEGLATPLGVLLNIADMSIDSHGEHVGFDRRLRDVEARYGRESDQYRECATMIRLLKATREWRLLNGEEPSRIN